MAGTAKPSVEGLGKEASYKLLSFNNQIGNTQPCGLFDEVWAKSLSETSFYWRDKEIYYVEIEILSEEVNIWKIGYAKPYRADLKIYKYNDDIGAYEDISSQITQTLQAEELVWEKTISNLPKGRYKFCGNPDVDYHTTGEYYRLDTEWYIEETVASSEDSIVDISNFPVKIGDNTIQTEADVLSYAKTLTNGEKQLLIADKLQALYVTDGNGGMIELSTGESGSVNISIDDVNISTDKVFSNQKTQELIDECLDKTTYASEENEGSVKMADKAKTIDVTDQLIGSAQYYGVGNGGTLNDTTLKLRPFPVGTATNRIDTLDFDILTKDVPQSIPFVREIADVNCFVQAFKQEESELNITDVFEDYNNELVSNHTENVVCDDNGLHIKDEYEINNNGLNSDGFYKIKFDDFLDIKNIEVEVID